MRNAMARRLHRVLECPVYQETVQQGLEIPSCVILPRGKEVTRIGGNRVTVAAEYEIIARGCAVEAVFYALGTVTDENGNSYRGEGMQADVDEEVARVRVTYRYQAQVTQESEDAPLMQSMETHLQVE